MRVSMSLFSLFIVIAIGVGPAAATPRRTAPQSLMRRASQASAAVGRYRVESAQRARGIISSARAGNFGRTQSLMRQERQARTKVNRRIYDLGFTSGFRNGRP